MSASDRDRTCGLTLALVIVGGMATTTILTLVVLPVSYRMALKLAERLPRLRALLDVIGRQLTGFTLVHLHWIPRHLNHDADRLSRAALGLPDKPAPRPVSARKRRGRR